MLDALGTLLGVEPHPTFVETRAGDVRRSQADPGAANRDLGFGAEVALADGLRETVDWIKTPP